MDILIRYGFTIEEIKIMMDTNTEIEKIPDNNIKELIIILQNIGCQNNHLKNILICNPFYLSKDIKDIINLINSLEKIGFNNLYSLFDTNPYLLNLSSEEIKKIYNNKLKEGKTKDEVIDFFNRTLIF